MSERDSAFVQKLANYLVDNVDHDDISELCEKLGVDEFWFGQFIDED